MTNDIEQSTNSLTNTDIVKLVEYAQGAPEYLPFYKACFAIAGLTGLNPETVIKTVRDHRAGEALIEEAMRVPLFPACQQNKRGTFIIF